MIVDFGAADIEGLLAELDAQLRDRGIAAAIYLVGGAALALAGMGGRRTRDVDGVAAPEAPVLAEAVALAERRGIAVTWLNTAAKQWVPGPPSGVSTLRMLPVWWCAAPPQSICWP